MKLGLATESGRGVPSPPPWGNFPPSPAPSPPFLGGDGGGDSPSGRRVPMGALFPTRLEREQECETERESES